MLTCTKCGNKEQFTVGAVEHHRYLVDSDKLFVEVIDGAYDCKMSDDFCCHDCDSFDVEDVECKE